MKDGLGWETLRVEWKFVYLDISDGLETFDVQDVGSLSTDVQLHFEKLLKRKHAVDGVAASQSYKPYSSN